MRQVLWDQCDANAIDLDDDGHETVVTCDLQRHAPPGDGSVTHYCEALDIYWKYADQRVRE